MKSSAKTVQQYLQQLPADRKKAVSAVREVILANLPRGYEEAMSAGCIAYQVPLAVLPKTYNGQPLWYAALASEKSYMSLHLMTVYGHKPTENWLRERFKASGKKLDMGKAYIRFRKLEDLPLDVIGAAIARVPLEKDVQIYQASRKK